MPGTCVPHYVPAPQRPALLDFGSCSAQQMPVVACAIVEGRDSVYVHEINERLSRERDGCAELTSYGLKRKRYGCAGFIFASPDVCDLGGRAFFLGCV